MDNNLNFNILFQLTGDNKVIASVKEINAGLVNIDKATVKVDNAFTKMVNHMNQNIKTIKLTSIIEQIQRVADAVDSLNRPGMELNASMHDLQAMTGVAGEKLQEIEGYARNSAKTFGGSAAQSVESYKLILGQLSPEIAKVPKALRSMGETVGYTSKLMGGDTTAATEVLTTAMNQYGISLDDPIKASQIMAAMMNVMAAAAGEGSAELPQIKQALEQSGMAAKAAGVSFEETNAAIQVLDKAGKKGSEGGVALRNVLATLGQGRFLPKAVRKEFKGLGIDINQLNNPNKTLTQRLNMLKPLLKDSALLSAVFGKENANAALALISQTDEVDRLNKAVKGTSEAYDQANIVMESQAEKNARLQAQVDDFKISLFNATGGAMGYASVLGNLARDVSNLIPLFQGIGTALKFVTSAQKMQALWTQIVTAAQWLWNAAMAANPIVWIVAGIAALVAVVIVCWNKFEGFRKIIFQSWEVIKLFGKTLKDYVINRVKEIISGVTGLGKALLAFFKGDWKNAWEYGKQAAADLAGVESASNAIGQFSGGVKDAWKEGADKSAAYTKAHQKSKEADVNSGIMPPVDIPGAGGTAGAGGNSKTKDKAKKTNESIATGGTKHNYITINLKEMIGIQNYNGSSNGAKVKAGDEILDQLIRITATATTAGE